MDNRKLKVLVVDDEPAVCNCIKLILMYDGHETQAVYSGEAALALFAPGKFDVILLDYSMPTMKGDRLAAAIKAQDPNQPLIMITALAPVLNGPMSVNAVVSKPFVLQDLRNAFTKALNRPTPSSEPA